ncbi:chain-length determining protein [Paenarthrobacter sp. AR 02]|uniref:chain-length determining protein n=1 Tax=Paenarthrobacter sp. AR 02 TaxID=2899821 RepID=UPI001F27D11A|nr:chain-length determining protein [Paenarthrobacter sp. AR 02]MCF3141489.1 chain-length determining protein [Paenarthrobacter sp. AR 02]
MDPVAVIRTLWHHKLIVLPVLLVTALAAIYVYTLAPRSYEAKATYAIVNPKIPTAAELEKNPQLSNLNSDNPYLRSADSSLIAQVVGTRLSDDATGDALLRDGLSTDFTVQRPPASFLIEISAVSSSKDKAVATVKALGARLESDLLAIQTVNGADARYLYTSLMIAAPDNATEQFSSRLRSLIVVLVAGVVLTFGAVSIARGLESSRSRILSAAPDGDRRKRARRRHEKDHDDLPVGGKLDELTIEDVLNPAEADQFFAANAPLAKTLKTSSNGKTPVKETSA